MCLRRCIALLLFVSACATSAPGLDEPVVRNPRLANLQRAAELPWRDGGLCVVQEASHDWSFLVERCFHALDHDRIQFHDPTGRCAVASTGAAAMGIGFCILVAPEIAAGAVIITGVVLMGFAIKEALGAYELNRGRPETGRPAPEIKPTPRDLLAKRKPRSDPSGQDWLPPLPPDSLERERRPQCNPQRVRPKGGNKLHDKCADGVPFNAFRGANALVNGKAFDAMQIVAGVLWEVKTDKFDTYPLELQAIVIKNQVFDFLAERELAKACDFDFKVGVRSPAHKAALEYTEPSLDGLIVVMDWC